MFDPEGAVLISFAANSDLLFLQPLPAALELGDYCLEDGEILEECGASRLRDLSVYVPLWVALPPSNLTSLHPA